jgi:hypothetical protein
MVEKIRYGVKFTAQTESGVQACMKRYYALPKSKRRGIKVVTPATMWKLTGKYADDGMETYWIVQATVTKDGKTVQIPTFYLDADIQGIITAEGCVKVATDIIDPFGQADSVNVNCDKWRFSIKE